MLLEPFRRRDFVMPSERLGLRSTAGRDDFSKEAATTSYGRSVRLVELDDFSALALV